MTVSVVVVGGPVDWISPSLHLPVLARHGERADKPSASPGAFEYSVQRWSLRRSPLSDAGACGLAGALPTNGELFVVVPASALAALDRRGRRDALEVADALANARAARKMAARVALVVDGDLAEEDCLEWASLLGARRRVSKAAAGGLFFSQSMIRPAPTKDEPKPHALWEGKLVVPGCKRVETLDGEAVEAKSDMSIPGFRLSIMPAARKRSEKRILDLMPVSAKKQISAPAVCMSEVLPKFAIGGFLGAHKELELQIVDGCNAITGFFCKDWVDRGVCLLLRLEKLNMLCFPRISGSSSSGGWVWDVAPVFELGTPSVEALDAAWFRKYELGTCGRSKVNFPCTGLTSLPVVSIAQSAKGNVASKEEAPGSRWITRDTFNEAISILDRAKAKSQAAKGKRLSNGQSQPPLKRPHLSSLQEPPSYDEIVSLERELLNKAFAARKRSRTSTLSREKLTDPPSAWTGRSSLSEDFNVSTGGASSKEQIAAFRQNRKARLQSMQSARNLAARQEHLFSRKDRSRRKSYRAPSNARTGSRSSVTPVLGVARSRARSLGVSDWHSLASKVQDTTILPRLEALPNFFVYEDGRTCGRVKNEADYETMQFYGDRRGLEPDETEIAPEMNINWKGIGIEYAPKSDDVRDMLLNKYGKEVGRSAQEFSSAWGTVDENGAMQKIKAATRALVDLRDSKLQALEASPELEDDPANDEFIAMWGRSRAYRSALKEATAEGEETNFQSSIAAPEQGDVDLKLDMNDGDEKDVPPTNTPEPVVVERKLELGDDGKEGLRELLARLERKRQEMERKRQEMERKRQEVDAEISRVRQAMLE